MPNDRGFSVIELAVALALLLVALAMFSGALVVVEGSAGRQLARGQTLNQMRQAMTTLDAELRSGFVAEVGSSPPSATIFTEVRGKPECVRWALIGGATQKLVRTAWTVGGGVGVSQVMATGIQNGKLGKNASSFTKYEREMFTPAIKVGVALGIELWVLAPSGVSGTPDQPSRFATTLTARNVRLANLTYQKDKGILNAC